MTRGGSYCNYFFPVYYYDNNCNKYTRKHIYGHHWDATNNRVYSAIENDFNLHRQVI